MIVPAATPLRLAAAALPVVAVLYLMAARRWSPGRAGAVGWALALAAAVLAYGAGGRLVLVSQGRALLLSLYVLYIVWSALAFYIVVDEAGAFPAISAAVAGWTGDATMQLLILAWVFASFLQGVTGFGVPVAVVAPLLVGLGFDAPVAVVAASLGHAWAVTFGSVASSFYAMLAVTGLSASALAPASAAMLGGACLACGLAVASLHRGWGSLLHGLPAVIGVGGVMAGVHFAVATSPMWPLASFMAGLAGLAAAAGVARTAFYRGRRGPMGAEAAASAPSPVVAVSAYGVLLAVVITAKVVPGVGDFLDAVRLAVTFPETRTALGWVNPAGTGRTISLFGHAGALIVYSSLAAYVVYRCLGCLDSGSAARVVRRTWSGAARPTLGIVALVAMALLMTQTGMTFVLADAVGRVSGPAYPAVAPLIGALGAFMTGSNTNSNVVFAPLQQSAAAALGYDAAVILAAQNVGGAVGSVFAPAKVVVGCSTVGLAGREGEVLRANLVYGLAIVVLAGLATLAVVALGWA